MACRPTIHKRDEEKLAGILPGAWFEWDWASEHWLVMHKDKWNLPYVVMRVCYPNGYFMPIDERLWTHLRHQVWVARQGYERWQREESERYRMKRDVRQAQQAYEREQSLKEIAPVAVALMEAEATGTSPVIPKTKFPGADLSGDGKKE